MARYLIDTDVMIDVSRRKLRTFDALIAATAIEAGLTLVSKNRKHFQMISGLNLEVPDY